MDLVPFVHEGLGNNSYLLEVGPGMAVLVDPDRSVNRYMETADERGWRIAAAFETHLHADFITGSVEVQARAGATLHAPAGGGVMFPHRGLVPGQRVRFGQTELEAIASPGHTPEHLAYVARRDGEPPLLFSGGAMIVGGAARTDLIAPRRTEELTRAQFHTLQEAFAELPDDTALLPTHGGGSFCSVASGGSLTSTLGEERASNPLLAHEDEDAFARWFPTTFPAVPDYFFRMRAVNRAGPRLVEEIAPPPALDAEAFSAAIQSGALVVDVRSAEHYAKGHVPGSLSIPFRGSYATWLGWLVAAEAALLFVADRALLDRVIEESLLVGYERFAGWLDGGPAAWARADGEVRRVEVADPEETAELLDHGALALDVREPSEVAAGGVPGSVSIPLGELPGRAGELPRDRALVAYCGHSERGTTGVSILERAGFDRPIVLRGGYSAWQQHRGEVSASGRS